MPITHLSAESYRRMPWKNGAGTTTEIAVFPAGASLDEFEWRLAIADLDRSGPFSSFPGVDRLLTVLPPGRVSLTVDGVPREMTPLEVVRFAGESEVSASLAAGPARDLNLMLRRGRVDASMEAIALDGELRVPLDGRPMVLCAIEGTVRLELGVQNTALEAPDCALVESGDEAEVTLRCDGGALLVRIAIRPAAT
jgi:environmental stress-induced protein Ves